MDGGEGDGGLIESRGLDLHPHMGFQSESPRPFHGRTGVSCLGMNVDLPKGSPRERVTSACCSGPGPRSHPRPSPHPSPSLLQTCPVALKTSRSHCPCPLEAGPPSAIGAAPASAGRPGSTASRPLLRAPHPPPSPVQTASGGQPGNPVCLAWKVDSSSPSVKESALYIRQGCRQRPLGSDVCLCCLRLRSKAKQRLEDKRSDHLAFSVTV